MALLRHSLVSAWCPRSAALTAAFRSADGATFPRAWCSANNQTGRGILPVFPDGLQHSLPHASRVHLLQPRVLELLLPVRGHDEVECSLEETEVGADVFSIANSSYKEGTEPTAEASVHVVLPQSTWTWTEHDSLTNVLALSRWLSPPRPPCAPPALYFFLVQLRKYRTQGLNAIQPIKDRTHDLHPCQMWVVSLDRAVTRDPPEMKHICLLT